MQLSWYGHRAGSLFTGMKTAKNIDAPPMVGLDPTILLLKAGLTATILSILQSPGLSAQPGFCHAVILPALKRIKQRCK